MNEETGETPAEDNPAIDKAQEKAELQKYIDELNEKIKSKNSLREENVSRVPPAESFFVKLDSSLKKNTAFVKKLKQFTATQIDSLLKDIRELNLTKYISEVCAAMLEAKFKMTDIPAAITLCSQLHQIYGDFAQQFFENWQKALNIKAGEKIQNMSKLRVDLRFYCDLISVGIFTNKVI
jgi:regulator of nonsense transcripts 2